MPLPFLYSLVDAIAPYYAGMISHKSIMARTWVHFYHAVEDSHTIQLLERRLFWMSTHTSRESIGTCARFRSADALAKFALRPSQLDTDSKRPLVSQKEVLLDALILIG